MNQATFTRKTSFYMIDLIGRAEARGYSAVDAWRKAQRDPSCLPERLMNFSPEDLRQAWIRCPSSIRADRIYEASMLDKFSAEASGERLPRAMALQRKIPWIAVDAANIDLIEDSINILTSGIKVRDDDGILSAYWSSGLTLDIMMEPEKLMRAMKSTVYADTPYEYLVWVHEDPDDLTISSRRLASPATEEETIRNSRSPEPQHQGSEAMDHGSARPPPSKKPRFTIFTDESVADTIEQSAKPPHFPIRFEESYERSHTRSQPGLDPGLKRIETRRESDDDSKRPEPVDVPALGLGNVRVIHRPSWQSTQEAILALTKYSYERQDLSTVAPYVRPRENSDGSSNSSPIPQGFFKREKMILWDRKRDDIKRNETESTSTGKPEEKTNSAPLKIKFECGTGGVEFPSAESN